MGPVWPIPAIRFRSCFIWFFQARKWNPGVALQAAVAEKWECGLVRAGKRYTFPIAAGRQNHAARLRNRPLKGCYLGMTE